MADIKSIRVKDFRSFGSQEQTLQLGNKVTVLIGVNNTGKSNVLRAFLRLLSDSGRDNPESDINIQTALRFRKNPPKEMVRSAIITAECVFSESDKTKALVAARDFYSNEARSLGLRPVEDEDWKLAEPTISALFDSAIPKTMLLEYWVEWMPGSGQVRSLGGPVTNPERIDSVRTRNRFGEKWMMRSQDLSSTYSSALSGGSIHEVFRRFNLGGVIDTMFGACVPGAQLMSREVMEAPPEKRLSYSDLLAKTPAPGNIRSFMFMMCDAEQAPQFRHAYDSLASSILAAFDDVEGIRPHENRWNNNALVEFRRMGSEFEMDTQGDGIKHVMMFFATLHLKADSLLLVDEPENHLHPALQKTIIPYFLEHGRTQLVIATHSDTIVSEIDEDRIRDNDVAIYVVELDENGCTRVFPGNDTAMLDVMADLGVPVSRFHRLLAARSRTLVFVEGPDDRDRIKEMAEQFHLSDQLKLLKPQFITYGGSGNVDKLPPEKIDEILKGNAGGPDQAPILIVRDRDEVETKSRPEPDGRHTLTWSRWEIENLVLSEDSIHEVLADVCRKLGVTLTDDVTASFERALRESIRAFIPRWLQLCSHTRIKRGLGIHWQKGMPTTLDETRRVLDDSLDGLNRAVEKAKGSLADLDRHGHYLEVSSLTPDGHIIYDFVTENLPGKELMALVRNAIIGAVGTQATDVQRDRLDDTVGSMTGFRAFMKHTSIVPTDLTRLLEAMTELQNTN